MRTHAVVAVALLALSCERDMARNVREIYENKLDLANGARERAEAKIAKLKKENDRLYKEIAECELGEGPKQPEPDAPKPKQSGECRRYAQLLSAERWARELGQTVSAVENGHRVNIWERPTSSPNGRGRPVGDLPPGAMAPIVGSSSDAYKIVDDNGAHGWVSSIQVEKTMWMDDAGNGCSG